VDFSRYWQEPDELDNLLEDPAIPTLLAPAAVAMNELDASSWWWSPIALDRQVHVQWTDEQPLEPPTLSGAAAGLTRWKAAALVEEHRAAERPRLVTAGVSGHWWSTPALSGLVTTTRTVAGLGAVKLMLVEDSMGWDSARPWPLAPATGCRVVEIPGPAAWTDLVERYPMDVTLSRRHDWWRATGQEGPWLVPDWTAVARDHDTVHLTVRGYLTTAGRALDVGDGHTVLAGWNPDESSPGRLLWAALPR
jgi:hypothetical protein